MAALVAQGLTNREIASRLFISERTAESHVEQIRGKLGFRSRNQITAWMATQTQAGEPGARPTLPAGERRAPAESLKRSGRRSIRLLAAGGASVVVMVAFLAAFAYNRLTTAAPAVPHLVSVAGTGSPAFSGDGGLAATSPLVHPLAVAIGPGGGIYIAEGNRIREIRPDGRITTIAGTGDAGNQGDGGLAVRAQLNSPQGLAVDSAGRIYIADTLSNRVRRVDPDGIIRTVAGTGDAGYVGDGKPGVEAELFFPTGLAIGFGDFLFIADTGNNVVRQLGADGIIRTFAGTGEAGYRGDGGPALYAALHGPGGLAFDDEGNLYLADTLNQRVRRVDVNGQIATVAGTGVAAFGGDDGRAIFAELNLATNPLEGLGQGLAVGPSGDVFIADGSNHRIRKVDVKGSITTIAQLKTPLGVAVDPHGTVYVADAGDNRVFRID